MLVLRSFEDELTVVAPRTPVARIGADSLACGWIARDPAPMSRSLATGVLTEDDDGAVTARVDAHGGALDTQARRQRSTSTSL